MSALESCIINYRNLTYSTALVYYLIFLQIRMLVPLCLMSQTCWKFPKENLLPKLIPTVGRLTVPDGSKTDCLLSGCFLATGHLQQPEATLRSYPRDLLLTSHQLSSCGILCRLRKSEFLFCNKLKTVLQGSCDTVRPT